MITSNKLPLLKRSRLRPVIQYDQKNKRYGSLVIMNTMDTKNLKLKLGTINLEYNNVVTMCYAKRLEQIKIRSKLVRENRLQGRQAYYDQIRAELPYLNGINEGKKYLNEAYEYSVVRYLLYKRGKYVENYVIYEENMY